MDRLDVLHLEDDFLDAELASRALAGGDLDVHWHRIQTGADFRQALAVQRFDAIVSDSSLAGLDGLEALQLARQARPHTPFIFLSGTEDERRVRECLDAGADDYVPKGQLWRLPKVLQHAHEHCERTRLQQRAQAQKVLVEAVQQLSLARSMADVMATVRRAARALAQADGATFVLRDGEQCHYADEDAIGPLWKGLRFPMADCISGWAMRHRSAAVVPDITTDPRIPQAAYSPTFVKSLVMVPIRTADPVGAIGVYWSHPYPAEEHEVALLQALADTTSVAIANVQLLCDLEQRVRERTAELEQANEELEAFSFSVSHDLRAPVRAIDGYTRLLAEHAGQRLDDECRRFLQHIGTSSTRMGEIIDDLLKLARAGRGELVKRDFNLSPLAREIVLALKASAPERDVRVEIAPEVRVHADVGLLHQVLQNLLSNAWKYSGRKQRACIEVMPWTTPEGERGFCVRDNGAGFEMAQAGRLFEPFHRLHAPAEFGGVGVGLAIVRRIVHKHGGRVWAEARPGEGAAFFVVLPAGNW